MAQVRPEPVACPVCGNPSSRVHGWHWRRLHDRPVGERAVVVDLRLRRLACAEVACPRRTFREQVPDLAVRYARRTPSLTALIGGLAVMLAGRATSAALAKLAVTVSRTTVLRLVMALPTGGGPVPRVLSVDDFALRRGRPRPDASPPGS
ncbi:MULTISPECIES: transposase family protein [unclassified Nonomuraea]|uniref:transposase family protein n=1 Tax=unclassified Nonomuraea TaxID=2593643 RepID=UPI0035C0CAE2